MTGGNSPRAERAGGLVLLLSTAAALAWANSAWGWAYEAIWHASLTLPGAVPAPSLSLLDAINEGLMALFFLLLGLGIRREGTLASRRAALPIAAALGGVVAPAGLYLAFNAGGPGAAGWGIPMATDPAFALALLALLGRRAPGGLRGLLATIAVVDDVAAVLVIAVVYHHGIDWGSLGLGVLIVLGLVAARRGGLSSAPLYALLAVALWLSFARAGVSPTLAGVVAALTLPTPLATRLEGRLAAWVNFLVVPLFALANAGVSLGSAAPAVAGPVVIGVAVGLVLGKQVGITGGAWLAVRSHLARLPEGVRWPHIYGLGWVGGLGFTTSLFIAGLAFGPTDLFAEAKLGILVAAIASGIGGYGILGALGPDGSRRDNSSP